jgi:aryl-alcohol dehydrogenase-like predicted oxidoreductase
VEHVSALQADIDGSLPETALRFCLSHPAVSAVIPGMRKVRNVEMNCRVSEQGPLEEAVLQKLKHHAWNKNFYC